MLCNPGSCSFPNSVGQKDRAISRARVSSGKLTEAERGKKNLVSCLCHLSHLVLSRKRPFIHRSVFYERNREPTEAASEWVTQLYLLIQDGCFTDKCEMVIKITRGWHWKEIQKKSLTEDNFLLEKIIRKPEQAIQKSREKYALAAVTYIL